MSPSGPTFIRVVVVVVAAARPLTLHLVARPHRSRVNAVPYPVNAATPSSVNPDRATIVFTSVTAPTHSLHAHRPVVRTARRSSGRTRRGVTVTRRRLRAARRASHQPCRCNLPVELRLTRCRLANRSRRHLSASAKKQRRTVGHPDVPITGAGSRRHQSCVRLSPSADYERSNLRSAARVRRLTRSASSRYRERSHAR